jgi:hypothetical protein
MKKLVAQLVLCAALALPSAFSRPAQAEKHPTNACGCYGEINACFCEKKAKCGCPGECEPKGCEEDRQKKLQKEIDEETKKAREAEKVQAEKTQAKNKPAKDDDDDDDADKKAAKGKAAPKMTPVQKKQLLKLIESYLAEHPEANNKMMSEVRTELQ